MTPTVELAPTSRRTRAMLNQELGEPASSTAVSRAMLFAPIFEVILAAGNRIYNLSCVDQLVVGGEQLDPFEEEGALLREEQREALVDRHQTHVRFDLAEIGLWVASTDRLLVSPGEDWPRSSDRYSLGRIPWVWVRRLRTRGHHRLELRGDPALQVVQAVKKAGLHQETRVGPPGIGPGVFVAGALNLPDHVDPPPLGSVPGVAQALKES